MANQKHPSTLGAQARPAFVVFRLDCDPHLGTQLESAALNNIAKEFWPDIRKDVFHKH